MRRVLGITPLNTAPATGRAEPDQGFWIQRLQQRSPAPPAKPDCAGETGTRQGEAPWIARLQQRAAR